MDVQRAQGPKPNVVETLGENCQIHQWHTRRVEDSIVAYFDGDWASDDIDRKSASGGYLMVGGRLHSLNRTSGQHALSSGGSEIMSMSELLKEQH